MRDAKNAVCAEGEPARSEKVVAVGPGSLNDHPPENKKSVIVLFK